MRKPRIDLEVEINSILEKNNKNKDLLESFIKNMEGKFYRGRSVRIFDKGIQLTLLTNEELCLVTQALYKSTGIKSIEPSIWFIGMEMDDAEKISTNKSDNNVDKIVEFNGFMKKGTQDEWIGYVTYKNIQDLYEKGLLTYNQETQRKATIVERGGNKYVLPTIFRNSVSNIADKMLKRKFYTNAITLNVTKTFREEIYYNAENGSLKIPIGENTELAIIDGIHRILGIVKALNVNPNLDDCIAVSVKNLTVDEAQEFIYQEALMNKQDLNYLRKSSTRDEYMEMVKTIARMGNEETNVLFNKIGFIEMTMKDCFVSGDRFVVGLKDNFKDLIEDSTNDKLMNIAKYIVEFFNHIAKTCPEQFNGEFEILRRRSVSTYSNFYVGMLALARKLFDSSDWKEELELVLEDMTWDIKEPTWKENGVTVDNLSIKIKKKIYDYFNSL